MKKHRRTNEGNIAEWNIGEWSVCRSCYEGLGGPCQPSFSVVCLVSQTDGCHRTARHNSNMKQRKWRKNWQVRTSTSRSALQMSRAALGSTEGKWPRRLYYDSLQTLLSLAADSGCSGTSAVASTCLSTQHPDLADDWPPRRLVG